MHKRIDWIDNLKGFSILLVLLGHSFISEDFYRLIYTMHMPLFFSISGYLYKNKNEDIKQFVLRKAKSLLVPYFIFATLSLPIGILLSKISGDNISIGDDISNFFYLNGSVGWNIPIWFLMCLFFVELIYFLLEKIKLNDRAICLFSLILGLLIYQLNVILPFGIHISIWGLLFYSLGQQIFKLKLTIKFKTLKLGNKITLLTCLLFLNVIFGNVLNNSKMEMYHSSLGNYMYYLISAIAGVMFMILVFSISRTSKILILFGRRTLFILGSHMFIIKTLSLVDRLFFGNKFFVYKDLQGLMIFFIVSLFYYHIIKFIEKYFKNVNLYIF